MSAADPQGGRVPTVIEMHRGFATDIRERVGVEPLTIAARIGMGLDRMAAAIDAEHRAVTVDPVIVGSQAANIAKAVTQAIVARAFPLPPKMLTTRHPEAERALTALAGIYGHDVGIAIKVATGEVRPVNPEWSVARALGAPASGPLVIQNAHRLDLTALWELRDLAGAGRGLVLLTTPEHRDRFWASEGPFYGFGAYAELPTLPLATWTSRLDGFADSFSVGELFRQTRGRTALMLDVVRQQVLGEVGLGSAWCRTVDAYEQEARTVMSLSVRIEPLAPVLLMAIAHGERPYGVDDRSDRIIRVLRRLQGLDLVEQPELRRWQIADPRMTAALRRLRPGHLELYPDTENELLG